MASLKNEILKGDAEQYCKNNGVVLRTILASWRVSKFTWRELLNTLDAYHIDKESVLEAMLCFDEAGYITVKLRDTHQTVSFWDYIDVPEELEFMIAKRGRDAAYNILSDKSISM